MLKDEMNNKIEIKVDFIAEFLKKIPVSRLSWALLDRRKIKKDLLIQLKA